MLRIRRESLSSSHKYPFLGPTLVLLAGLTAAPVLAFNAGDVLVSVGNGQIKRFTPTGTFQQTLDTTLGGALTGGGMCFDATRNVFEATFGAQRVAKFDSTGTLVTNNFGSGYNSDPESCILDMAGSIFVGQADGTHQIKKFDSAGSLITNFSPAVQNRGTDWIDLAADQFTMFYTSEGSSIKRFNVCTNTQAADFATGLPGSSCFALRIRLNGEVLVCLYERHTSPRLFRDSHPVLSRLQFLASSRQCHSLRAQPRPGWDDLLD